MKRNYSDRHIRRIIHATTDADLQKISRHISEPIHLEASSTSVSESANESSGIDDTSFICNDDHNSNSIHSEDEQRTEHVGDSESDGIETVHTSDMSSVSGVSKWSNVEPDNSRSDSICSNFESDCNMSERFKRDIATWAIKHNVPHNARNSLLEILRKFTDNDLPKDIRTLLKTPRNTNIISIRGGSYCHFGSSGIMEQMINACDGDVQNINLLLNIDGLPISKSSNASLWPILCSNDLNSKVYIVGAYYGLQKPNDSNEFLGPLVEELVTLVNDGFHVNEKLIDIRLHALICDAPAKSFALSVKSHTGYYSCTTCTIEGPYINNRVCFPKTVRNPQLRTDKKFAINFYEDYQTGYTILNSIPYFGAVTKVPRDYLHVVCFCAIKKPGLLWMKYGPLSVRLSSQTIKDISKALVSLRNTVPNDFARRPRALSDVYHWKATEFRNFLLYTGPVVLKGVLKDDVYHNFITLHVAITLLASPVFCKNNENIDYAEAMLEHFVTSFQEIYGAQYVSHNIHNLLHLSSDVRVYGPLDAFSAFRFENFMSSIKKLLRKSEKPLEQLARRYHEIEALRSDRPVRNDSASSKLCFQNEHTDGPLADFRDARCQYEIMSNNSLKINCDSYRDNCCNLDSGECVVIKNIVQAGDEKMYVIEKKLKYLDNLYCLPCPSSKFGIKIVSEGNTTRLNYWPVRKIKSKAWRMPYKRDYVVVPVSHSI